MMLLALAEMVKPARRARSGEPRPVTVWSTWLAVTVVLLTSGDRVSGQGCTQSGNCQCSGDKGTIDLSAITGGSATAAAFPDVPDNTGAWTYSYSPCTPFTEGTGECSSVAVCQVSTDGSETFPTGAMDSAKFMDDGSGGVMVEYSQTDSGGTARTTKVSLTCLSDATQQDSMTTQGEDPNNQGTYLMTLSSLHCCFKQGPVPPGPNGGGGGGGGGLSVGSILCIGFVAILVVYVAAGVAIQKGVRKAEGKEVIPNYSVWSSVPGLIKEGFGFTFRLCRGKGGYDKV